MGHVEMTDGNPVSNIGPGCFADQLQRDRLAGLLAGEASPDDRPDIIGQGVNHAFLMQRGAGLRISAALRSKELRAADLERIVGDVFLHHEYRKLPRPITLPILDTLSLAEDIDTEEEAADLSATVLDDEELGPLDEGEPDGDGDPA